MVSHKNIASLLFLLVAVSVANGFRVARQARSCSPGVQCVPLASCPALLSLLDNPTRAKLRRIREAICGNDRRNPEVCCGDSSVTPTNTPPTSPSPTPTPVTPTSPTPTTGSPGEGEKLLPSVCGQGTSNNRIFNGEEVEIGSYPWMAVFGYRTNPAKPLEWACGGALINENYIVTAAHCVQDLPLEEIRLGEHHLDTDPDCSGANCPSHQSFKITRSQITLHPNYDTRTPYSDDIALIRLDRKAVLNNFVHPICYPESRADARSFLSGREAIIAGWGMTEQGTKSRVLKRVEVPMVELQACQAEYNNLLNTDQLCFGGVGQRDSCDGDSGGPIFQSNRSGVRYTLLGIVSFGITCGKEPAIYTNAASYRTWVTQNLRP